MKLNRSFLIGFALLPLCTMRAGAQVSDAQKAADEARKVAIEAQKKADDAQKYADAQKAADDARKLADEAQRKADELRAALKPNTPSSPSNTGQAAGTVAISKPSELQVQLKNAIGLEAYEALKHVSAEEVEGTWRRLELWKYYPKSPGLSLFGTRRHRDDAPIEYTPIFLDPTVSTNQSWADWNRVDFGATFIPDASASVRAFIDIHAVGQRLTHEVYVPVSIDMHGGTATGVFDLTFPPRKMVFNREMYTRYWDRIHSKTIFQDAFEPGRFYFTFGVSPEGFKLGQTSSAPTDANKTTYMLGGAYAINPYVYLNYGVTTNDGKAYKLGFGISADIGIIGNIFKP